MITTCGLVVSPLDRAEPLQSRVDGLAELGDCHEVCDGGGLYRSVVSGQRCEAVCNVQHDPRLAVLVVLGNDLRAAANRMPDEGDPLREVLLEHQPELALLAKAIEVGLQILAQGVVVHASEQCIDLTRHGRPSPTVAPR